MVAVAEVRSTCSEEVGAGVAVVAVHHPCSSEEGEEEEGEGVQVVWYVGAVEEVEVWASTAPWIEGEVGAGYSAEVAVQAQT